MTYVPAENRYEQMPYRRTGRSGLQLPAISLGLWHNFGDTQPLEIQRAVLRRAFDLGVTHFDLANNYGPPGGSAEENFGRLLEEDLRPHRDEIVVSTKAGYYMWEGPYGDWGSRKYLVSSLDQSLQRMGLDYVDIFYHHRPDPETPLEETMGALDQIVRSGKALYVGISNYRSDQVAAAAAIRRVAWMPSSRPSGRVLAIVDTGPLYAVADGVIQRVFTNRLGGLSINLIDDAGDVSDGRGAADVRSEEPARRAHARSEERHHPRRDCARHGAGPPDPAR